MIPEIFVNLNGKTTPAHELTDREQWWVAAQVSRLPALEAFGEMLSSAKIEQTPLNPPYKCLTPAPENLHARLVGGETVKVQYIADCAEAGGQFMRHLCFYEGQWIYCEDAPGFASLALV